MERVESREGEDTPAMVRVTITAQRETSRVVQKAAAEAAVPRRAREHSLQLRG